MVYILEWIAHFNNIVKENIAQYFPETGFLSIFGQYPLQIILIFFILIGGITLFFDFIKDAWKVPIAIFGDMLDVIAVQYPGVFDVLASLYSVAIFWMFAKDPKWFQKMAMISAGTEALIGINFPFAGVGNLGNATNLFPTNTILMIIATVID